MSPGPYLTTQEYAVHRGCSDSFVRRLRRNGRLVLSPDSTLIDREQSDALLDATSDPLRGGARAPEAVTAPGPDPAVELPAPGGPSIKEAVRRERLAKARLAELELGEEAGDLTRRREVHRDVFTLARQALESMRTMGSRLRTKLAATSDPAECEALINTEIAKICDDMQRAANEMRQQPADAARSAA